MTTFHIDTLTSTSACYECNRAIAGGSTALLLKQERLMFVICVSCALKACGAEVVDGRMSTDAVMEASDGAGVKQRGDADG